jgi:hypothetical protein
MDHIENNASSNYYLQRERFTELLPSNEKTVTLYQAFA